MKWSTNNSKHHDYNENHEIYVGTQTGSFKKITSNGENSFFQQNLQDISSLSKNSNITTMDFGSADKKEILIGRDNKFAQVYDLEQPVLCSNIELLHNPIVGLARYENHLIAGLGNGIIQKLQDPEPMILYSGDHMSRLRQCPFDRKLVATGGQKRQNHLKVFNIESGKEVFKAKNLPNDFLQLEVPIWDSDIGFIDANTVATCSRYGYIRLYDTRKQRRPVMHFASDKPISFSSMAVKDNYIYSGTTIGELKAFDTRNGLKNFVHTYKGFTGSVSDLYLDETGKYVASSSLDRYVRIHHTDSCVLMYQCYVKSKATRILIRSVTETKNLSNDEDKESALKNVTEEEEDESPVKSSEPSVERDDEYDDIFDKMPTVCDSESGEELETEKPPAKRKNQQRGRKIKKKKI